MEDTVSRRKAIEALKRAEALARAFGYHVVIETVKDLPSAGPPVLTCDGCRHAGTYDTDFPCSGCIRREKDYYEQE